jgi:CO dehydrogenase maturation factor
MDEAEREARRRRREEWAAANLDRQAAVIDDLVERADDPVGWLAVRRQARSYLRHLATWKAGRGFSGIPDLLDTHQKRLDGWVREADGELARLDDEERRRSEGQLGLRLAVMGKGGAGKTVICSTLARLLARRGRNVLAADLDTNPGLCYSIGMDRSPRSGPPAGGHEDQGLPLEALEEREGAAYGWQLRTGLLPRQAVEQFAVRGPDGVALLSLGKIGDVDKSSARRTVVAMIQILLGFGEPGWDVIGDLEAGPTTPFERYHAFADDVVVVVGPAWRSAMTARRLLPMVGEGRTTTVVANRFRDEPDHAGLAPQVRIPFDPDVAEAERQGLSPLDACPDSPAVRAIEAVAELFTAQTAQEVQV